MTDNDLKMLREAVLGKNVSLYKAAAHLFGWVRAVAMDADKVVRALRIGYCWVCGRWVEHQDYCGRCDDCIPDFEPDIISLAGVHDGTIQKTIQYWEDRV